MLYFAYGMNLDPKNMFGYKAVGPAVLRGWKFVPRGIADVKRCVDAKVYGVLWDITPEQLRRLDGREGYPHLYTRVEAEVTPLKYDGTSLKKRAIVYHMVRPSEMHKGGGLTPYMLDTITAGYEHFGLPIAALKEVLNA